MDKKTQNTLARISRGIPARLANNTTKVVVDTSEEDVAKAALRNPNISREKKNQLSRLIERGAFRREETVINEEVVAEIDKYNSREVAKARRAGMLSDPNKDPFVRERQKRLERRGRV